MKQFESLSPDIIHDVLSRGNRYDVSDDIKVYILQIDRASKLFKGNVQRAAKELQKDYPMLSIRTCMERVNDAIVYLNAGTEALPAKYWYNYYADRYEDMARLYSKTKATARYAQTCMDKALQCRLQIASSGLPEELLTRKQMLVSPDTHIERLGIKKTDISKSFAEAIELIDSFDISETEKIRIKNEVKTELGVDEDGEI